MTLWFSRIFWSLLYRFFWFLFKIIFSLADFFRLANLRKCLNNKLSEFYSRKFSTNFCFAVLKLNFARINVLNPNWHELWKQKRMLIFGLHQGTFFTSKKVWKSLIKTQLTKWYPKKDKGVESVLPHAN